MVDDYLLQMMNIKKQEIYKQLKIRITGGSKQLIKQMNLTEYGRLLLTWIKVMYERCYFYVSF